MGSPAPQPRHALSFGPCPTPSRLKPPRPLLGGGMKLSGPAIGQLCAIMGNTLTSPFPPPSNENSSSRLTGLTRRHATGQVRWSANAQRLGGAQPTGAPASHIHSDVRTAARFPGPPDTGRSAFTSHLYPLARHHKHPNTSTWQACSRHSVRHWYGCFFPLCQGPRCAAPSVRTVALGKVIGQAPEGSFSLFPPHPPHTHFYGLFFSIWKSYSFRRKP